MPDRPLARVVVPGNTILVKEAEQRFSVPLKPFLVSLRHIQAVLSALDHRFVEPVHLLLESAEVSRTQTPSVDGLNNGHYEIFHCRDKLLKLLIKRKFP